MPVSVRYARTRPIVTSITFVPVSPGENSAFADFNASWDSCADMRAVADEVECAVTPTPFWAVGVWYEDFTQTSDEEVQDLLARAERERLSPASTALHR